MKMFIFFWSREVLHWMEGVLGFKVIVDIQRPLIWGLGRWAVKEVLVTQV